MKKKEKIYSVAAVLIIIDQFIKLFIKSKMNLFDKIDIIPNFFSIYYIENDGAAFSILGGATLILIIVSFVVLFLLDRFVTKENIKSKFGSLSYGMVFAGIVGNLIDRCLYGSVIDYLSFYIFSYHFPVFNLADICIVVGIFLVVINIFVDEYKNKKVNIKKNI